MKPLFYIDRKSGKLKEEKVYGAKSLEFLYGNSFLGKAVQKLAAKNSIFSYLYGFFQKLPFSKRKITPFIQEYGIDVEEFMEPADSFCSFNEFFIRKLKKEARPIDSAKKSLIAPADARYLFFNDFSKTDGFFVKGKKFSLTKFLMDEKLAGQYEKGALLIARLCPVDYHRFHFPCDGKASLTRQINGWLHSVNPIALFQNIDIFSENKRAITEIESLDFGKIQFIEVGATFVGSIYQTYKPGPVEKGEEKGYFSFGGSSLVLLFEPDKVIFDEDLIKNSLKNIETLCRFGEKIGINRL